MLCVCLQEVEIIIIQSLIGNNKTVLCRSLVILLLFVPVRNMYGFTVNVSCCVY
jgi:hypothetical protein